MNYVAVDGPESCMAAVKDAMAGKLDGCFIEMSFCRVVYLLHAKIHVHGQYSVRSNTEYFVRE